jgi:hypothetical protein
MDKVLKSVILGVKQNRQNPLDSSHTTYRRFIKLDFIYRRDKFYQYEKQYSLIFYKL